jgi:hypothetical protein
MIRTSDSGPSRAGPRTGGARWRTKRFLILLLLLLPPARAPLAADGSHFRSPGVEADLALIEEVLEPALGGEFFVYAPLRPLPDPPPEPGALMRRLFESYRVLTPDGEQPARLRGALSVPPPPGVRVEVLLDHAREPRERYPAGYRGVLLRLEKAGRACEVQILGWHAHRWLVWARRAYAPKGEGRRRPVDRYALAVGRHLAAAGAAHRDGGSLPDPPAAAGFGLEEQDDLFAEPPPYVIGGYRNYLDFLEGHREIEWPLARGIYEFWPTRETLDRLVAMAPRGELFPNKEISMFQREVREFAERGGEFSDMMQLTGAGFEDLEPGHYFFALDRLGRIRMGRELSRLEVARAEERGEEPARANHALLYPGEAVLSAGEIEIERDEETGGPILRRLTAASGHYFYSNKTGSVREDVSVNGDRYLLSLGHVVRALRETGIPLDRVRVAKY